MHKIQPLSLDSPKQLSWLLRDHLGLDIDDFDGEESTGKAVLEKLAGQGRQDIAEFIKYRKATKLTTAFFPSYRAMHVNGIIHCSFNPLGTRTGRLSSSRPNLQQVARNIKRLFMARPGYKLCVRDMKAIEPYLICYYTADLNLYDILSHDKDFHNFNTAIFFDLDSSEEGFKKKYAVEREVGKEVGLSLMYGSGRNRLMESAQKRGFVWSSKEAQYKVERFKEFYEGVYKFREEVINPALLDGGSITNILGRPFVIPCPEDIHMKGMNTLIQGGASDLVCNSAHRVQRQYDELNMDAHVVILEHDCIIVEAAESDALRADEMLADAMTDYKLNTPLGPLHLQTEGGVCDRWEK
jgi:DNA polymerase-1